MSDSIAPWAESAAALPIAFAQVREDPRIDQALVSGLGEYAHVCMVASGGCTAAVLATLPNVAAIHLVDPNPAQLALARLKLRLLSTSANHRLAVLGHASMTAESRAARLEAEFAALELDSNILGPMSFVATQVPDFAGRYEQCFRALQDALATRREELTGLLRLSDPAEQARRIASQTALGRDLDVVFDTVLSLRNLVALFGEGATRNPVEPFARHFAKRVRQALATLPAADNPFLWQMLTGKYPKGVPADWFTLPPPTGLPDITWQRAFMADALATTPPASFNLVHLSNILDWLSPEEATATLELAARALRVGGTVVIRQLNSTLAIPGSGPMFAWDERESATLLASDRSFFYRDLHVGRKR